MLLGVTLPAASPLRVPLELFPGWLKAVSYALNASNAAFSASSVGAPLRLRRCSRVSMAPQPTPSQLGILVSQLSGPMPDTADNLRG